MDDVTLGCCAPTSRLNPCDQPPVPRSPIPLCVHHLAMTWRFITEQTGFAYDGESGRLRKLDAPDPGKRVLGTIYYLRVGQYVKIGFTTNMDQRMRAYPPDAEILAVEPGPPSLERQRHRQFEESLSARAEWFSPSPDLMAHIDEVKQLPAEARAAAQGSMHPAGIARVGLRLTSGE